MTPDAAWWAMFWTIGGGLIIVALVGWLKAGRP